MIAAMVTAIDKSKIVMKNTFTSQQKAYAASLRVSWILNKKMIPISHSEIVKDCLLAISTEMLKDTQHDGVIKIFKSIPLSHDTNSRRLEDIDNNLKELILDGVRNSETGFSLAVDETGDINGVAQLGVYVRYFKDCIRDELLDLVPMHAHTRGKDIFESLVRLFDRYELCMSNMVCIVTDGCPSMISASEGLVSRLRQMNPNLLSYHCIIHCSALAAKLSGDLSNLMCKLLRLINFLRSASQLQRRLLRAFLEEVEAEYTDLLLHNDVRWLSRGQCLNRLWTIRGELLAYLKESSKKGCDDYIFILQDKRTILQFAFLVDIFRHLNGLNVKLQGKNCSVFEMYAAISSFKKKLSLFHDDLSEGDFTHFDALNELNQSSDGIDSSVVQEVCCIFIQKLKSEMESRFANLDSQCKDVNLLFSDPFTVDIRGSWKQSIKKLVPDIDIKNIQLELTNLQEDDELRRNHALQTLEVFYSTMNKEIYPTIRKMGIKLLTLHGTTWICEGGFSKMSYIKNRYRSKLTQGHLSAILRTATTSQEPNFEKLTSSKKGHFSH